MSGDQISVWQKWADQLPPIDLGGDIWPEEVGKDIIGRLISGDVDGFEFSHKFQRCSFKMAVLSNSKLKNVDFKDCSFLESTFIGCDLGSGSTVSCTYSKCVFIGCSLSDAAFHECMYLECRFIECDFRSSMVRNSQIKECLFEECKTSNKVFDGCILFNNSFKKTSIDFRAIIDNFGLDCRQIDQGLIRVDRSYPEAEIYEFDQADNHTSKSSQTSPFESLRLDFYLAEGELEGSTTLDKVFEAEAWLSMVRAPINFMRLLQDFSSFVLYLYDTDKVPVLIVVKMYVLTDKIWSSFQGALGSEHLAQTAAGVNLQCLQRIEHLDRASDRIVGNTQGSKIVYRSFDWATDEQIDDLSKELAALLPESHFFIRPRNSPVDIVFSIGNSATLLLGVYLFLNTKTRIQLAQQKAKDVGRGNTPLVNLEIGGASGKEQMSLVHFSGNLPRAVTFCFEINFSSTLISRIKNVVKDVHIEK